MELLYACEEHMDEAMDEVIDGKETYPVINEITRIQMYILRKRS